MVEIRVTIIDDHAIVRQGRRAMIDREPDLRVVGEAPSAGQATPMPDRTRGQGGAGQRTSMRRLLFDGGEPVSSV
jgi:hypothetical protein